MRSLFVLFVCLFVCSVSFTTAQPVAPTCDYYVDSLQGNNVLGNGTIASPYANLTYTINTIIANTITPNNTFYICLHNGDDRVYTEAVQLSYDQGYMKNIIIQGNYPDNSKTAIIIDSELQFKGCKSVSIQYITFKNDVEFYVDSIREFIFSNNEIVKLDMSLTIFITANNITDSIQMNSNQFINCDVYAILSHSIYGTDNMNIMPTMDIKGLTINNSIMQDIMDLTAFTINIYDVTITSSTIFSRAFTFNALIYPLISLNMFELRNWNIHHTVFNGGIAEVNGATAVMLYDMSLNQVHFMDSILSLNLLPSSAYGSYLTFNNCTFSNLNMNAPDTPLFNITHANIKSTEQFFILAKFNKMNVQHNTLLGAPGFALYDDNNRLNATFTDVQFMNNTRSQSMLNTQIASYPSAIYQQSGALTIKNTFYECNQLKITTGAGTEQTPPPIQVEKEVMYLQYNNSFGGGDVCFPKCAITGTGTEDYFTQCSFCTTNTYENVTTQRCEMCPGKTQKQTI